MSLRKRITSLRERQAEALKKRRESAGKRATGKGPERRSATKASGKRPVAKTSGRRAAVADVRKLGARGGSVLVELLKLAREMLVIPLQLWLALAEIVGSIVLRCWRQVVLPLLVALLRLGRAAVRLGQRHVTPARALAAVCLVAIGALAASQWLDYRSVTVGTDAYSGSVGIIAPAPEVETEIAGNAHGWVMLPLAVVALVALGLTISGRPRAALLLVPIGIAAIAISLAVDAPKGLDEGDAAVAYEGASAGLLEGFWLQIATGAVLIACGLMLPRSLRPAPARSATPRKRARPSRVAALAGRGKGKVQGAGT